MKIDIKISGFEIVHCKSWSANFILKDQLSTANVKLNSITLAEITFIWFDITIPNILFSLLSF